MKITKGELLRFFGYMLALTLNSVLPLDKMWRKTSPPNSTAPPPAMGRFGMSQGRFNKIKSKLRFGPSDQASFEENKWCHLDPMVDAFNAAMKMCIIAGWLLAPDESMFAWLGQVGLMDILKAPYRIFLRRKPEPLGLEIKNIGDAQCGAILHMELTKGKADLIKPKYYQKNVVGACCATTLRLSEPWFGTKRVVMGDSWFASVLTAEKMYEKGLFFVGDVKTGSVRFPKDALFKATAADNGAWATMHSTLDLPSLTGDTTVPIYCVSHRRGESIH